MRWDWQGGSRSQCHPERSDANVSERSAVEGSPCWNEVSSNRRMLRPSYAQRADARLALRRLSMTLGSYLILLFLFSIPLLAQNVTALVGPPAATPLAGERLDRETERVAALLRCPVCQGLSIKDSPATMAVQMKAQTRELLAAGYSDDQILLYYEKSYGQFVRLEPPRSGINWIVWLAPALLLVAGIGFVAMRFRRTSESAAAELVPSLADHVDGELAPWLVRVRQIAYGDEAR
jgi:cytochrome c-type biogenesis protein CcmH